MSTPVRMWINQPSTHQAFNKLHGAYVLAIREDSDWSHVWFTSGPVVSQQIRNDALCTGWPNEYDSYPTR